MEESWNSRLYCNGKINLQKVKKSENWPDENKSGTSACSLQSIHRSSFLGTRSCLVPLLKLRQSFLPRSIFCSEERCSFFRSFSRPFFLPFSVLFQNPLWNVRFAMTFFTKGQQYWVFSGYDLFLSKYWLLYSKIWSSRLIFV